MAGATRRRISGSEVGSLELLLDTICNMFGGIILMAILVVIQTQASARGIARVTEDGMGKMLDERCLREEVLRLENTVVELKIREAETTRRYMAKVSPEVDAALTRRAEFAKALAAARHRLEDVRTRSVTQTNFLATSPIEMSQLDRRLSSQEAALEKARALVRLASQLPPNVRLPHQRGAIAGQAEYFLVKGNKVYYVGYRHRGHAHLHVESSSELLQPEEGIHEQLVRIVPDERRGSNVPQNLANRAAAHPTLASCRAGFQYVVFLVWDDSDSFASFQRLKNAVLQDGFHYVLSPHFPDARGMMVDPAKLHEAE